MKKALIWVLALGLIGGLSVTIARSAGKGKKFEFQYAAKFVCGRDPQGAFLRVIPGFYSTAIAIHNPNNRRVRFRKKVALTFPADAPRERDAEQLPGLVSDFQDDTLDADQALQVDCEEIFGKEANEFQFSEFFPTRGPESGFPPYIQGFVIIESKHSLDVSAVYTAGQGDPRADPGSFLVRSIDMEQIKERRIKDRRRDDDDDDDDDKKDD